MKFAPEDVAKIARLARLSLSDEKLAAFAGQFNDILGYMEELGQADTAGVEPLYHPVEQAPALREDTVRKDLDRAEILANAPRTDGAFFIVPKIV